MDQSIMKHDEQDINFQEKLIEQYQQAVKNGFEGTVNEYLAYRDYT